VGEPLAVHFNQLAAECRVPISKETHHLSLGEDVDFGETKKTPKFFRWAFQTAVGEPVWVPTDLDVDFQVSTADASAQATRFWICALDIWLPRCLASVGRLWKRLGYKEVHNALSVAVEKGDPRRTCTVLQRFTESAFAKIVTLAYDFHLNQTARAFFPGPFLHDSRTKALLRYVGDHFGSADLVSGTPFTKLLIQLAVIVWAVLQLRPEVVQHFLALKELDSLVAPFLDSQEADPSLQLVSFLRELWADAPVNGTDELDPREAVLAEIASHMRQDKGCWCKEASGCILGRAAQQRHQTIIAQRAQMFAYHLASFLKGGEEQTSDEARDSAKSLAIFLSDEQQMADFVHACGAGGGEQEIITVVRSRRGRAKKGCEAPYLGIYELSRVRATLFGRLLNASLCWLRLQNVHGAAAQSAHEGAQVRIPGDVTRMPRLADEPAKRVLAFVTSPDLGATLGATARDEIVEKVLAHGDHILECGERLLPKLVKAWATHTVQEHPELEHVVPVLLEDMRLGYRWAPSRREEPPCEIAKGVIGRLVDLGLLSANDFPKGEYHDTLAAAHECGANLCTETPTGWPAVPCCVDDCLGMYIDTEGTEEHLMLSRGSYLPGLPRMEAADEAADAPASPVVHQTPATGKKKSRSQQSASSTSTCAPAGATEQHSATAPKRAQLARALVELRRARRMLEDATQARSAAQEKVCVMEEHVQSLQGNETFAVLRDRVCGRDAYLAYHIWCACLGSSKWTCGLHLDDLDLGLLLNLVVSIGVSESNEVVQLRGSLLMIVLTVSSSSLSGVDCEALGWSANAAHDEVGNIILLEPSLKDVVLPAGYQKADAASSEAVVLKALQEGRCVLAFYRSGGVVAGQLGHHWHLVTAMDPRDIVAGVVRIGAIAYPQRAAIVSSTALHQHSECSDESAAALAEQLQQGQKSKLQSVSERSQTDVDTPEATGQRQLSAKAKGKRKLGRDAACR
jgi:hypothetical protein